MAEIIASVVGAVVAAALARLRSTPVDFFLPPSDRDLKDRLLKALQALQAFLRDAEGVDGLTEVNKTRVVDIRDLAYAIEDAVDKFLLDVPRNQHQYKVNRAIHHVAHPLGGWSGLRHLSEAVNELEAKIKQMKDLDSVLLCSSDQLQHVISSGPAAVSSPVAYLDLKEDELVGIDTRSSKLAGAILEGGSPLAVISVVGPRGSGKTTVLKQVFKKLKGEFKQCVWIDVQSASNPKAVFESVVAAVGASRWKSISKEMSDEDRLAKLLKKRYALFIDGILRKADCSHLMSLLPDHNKGSRVIVAAREQDATSYSSRLESRVYEVECLTWDESWKLLCKLAFPGGECPPHLWL